MTQSQQTARQAPAAAPAKPAAPAPPPPMVDDRYGGGDDIMALPQARLIAILRDPQGSVYAKAKACQRLAVAGDASAVAAIAPLLSDARLSHYARFALEPMPFTAAGAALRDALPKLKGNLLAGVINSIGVRRDKGALDALSRLTRDADPAVAAAAYRALAELR